MSIIFFSKYLAKHLRMPQESKKGKPQTKKCKNVQVSVDTTVANVNKEAAMSNLTPQATETGHPITVDHSDQVENIAGSSKQSKIVSETISQVEQAEALDQNNDRSTQVKFCEGDHIVKMCVDRNEDIFRDGLESDEEGEIMEESSQKNNTSVSRIEDPVTPVHSQDISQDISNVNHTPLAKRRRLCEEEKQEVIGVAVDRAVGKIQDIMDKSGFSEAASLIKQHFGSTAKGRNKQQNVKKRAKFIEPNSSEITIYHDAVEDLKNQNKGNPDYLKRISSSSEELINTSDEMVDSDNNADKFINAFITENRPQVQAEEDRRGMHNQEQPAPGMSYDQQREQMPGDDVADQLIKDAEKAKVKMFQTLGKDGLDLSRNFVHSVMVDEDYLVLGANIDESLEQKIEKGEYVDLGKLLPRDRILQEEDQRLQMVNHNGQSYWVPISDHLSISNYTKWELAFIYTLTFILEHIHTDLLS